VDNLLTLPEPNLTHSSLQSTAYQPHQLHYHSSTFRVSLILNMCHNHHHHHVHEVLGCVSCSLILKMILVHLFLGRPMFFRPFGLYCCACFGILFVSILCTCCIYFFWYCFLSFTTFCAPSFSLIH
jgi:hypothetical protein